MSRIKNNPLNWIDKEPEEEEKQSPIRPQNVRREYTKSSQEGLKENWTRATFIVREDILEKFKDYAYTERLTHKELINSILEEYLKDKEIIERGEN
ncbi:MAG: hypothetical protein ACOYJ1_10235 [Peptococcales bacterium]|jgi:predicted DNA binding CopG/RHH family protein